MNRIIFFHIPKTAGNSIYSLIRNDERVVYVTHNTWAKDWRHLDKYSKTDAFTFAFVRNPWDRLCSSFFYLNEWFHGAANENFITEAKGSFEKFVMGKQWMAQSKKNTLKVVPHLLPQYKWLIPEVLHDRQIRRDKTHLIPDFIGRYENLTSDLKEVAEATGLNFKDLPRYNASEHRNYKDYYTPHMVDIVAEVYKTDIQLFGYEF